MSFPGKLEPVKDVLAVISLSDPAVDPRGCPVPPDTPSDDVASLLVALVFPPTEGPVVPDLLLSEVVTEASGLAVVEPAETPVLPETVAPGPASPRVLPPPTTGVAPDTRSVPALSDVFSPAAPVVAASTPPVLPAGFPGLVAPLPDAPGVLPLPAPVVAPRNPPVVPVLKSLKFPCSAPVVIPGNTPVVPATPAAPVTVGLTTPVVPAFPDVEMMGTEVSVMPVVKGSVRRPRVVPVVSLLDVVIAGMDAAMPGLLVTSVIAAPVLNMAVAVVVETANVELVGAVSLHSNCPAIQ